MPDPHPMPATQMVEPLLQPPFATRLNLRAWGLCLCLAALAGCRSVDNAQIDLLERELRQQEDYIYELEDYLIQYSEKLRQCRIAAHSEPAADAKSKASSPPRRKQPQLVDDTPRSPRTNAGRQTPRPTRASPPPAVAVPDDSIEPIEPEAEPDPVPVEPEDFVPGPLEIGPTSGEPLRWQKGTSVADAEPRPYETAADDALLTVPDPADFQLEPEPTAFAEASPDRPAISPANSVAAAAPAGLAASDNDGEAAAPPESQQPNLSPPQLPPPTDPLRRIADRLEVRRIFAGPPSPTGNPESLLVIVEALNAADEPVDSTGGASLMVMVRDEHGALHRINRWDFTDQETQAAWQSSKLGDGLHLELPLSESQLPEGPLEMWARVIDTEGRKLLTRAPVEFEVAQLAALEQASEPDQPPAAVAAAPSPLTEAAPDAAAGPAAEETSRWRNSLRASHELPTAENLRPGKASGWSPREGGPTLGAASGGRSLSRAPHTAVKTDNAAPARQWKSSIAARPDASTGTSGAQRR